MEVERLLLIGSVLIFILAIFLIIIQYRERLHANISSAPISLRRKTDKQERRIYPRYNTSLRIKYKVPHKFPLEEDMSWVKDISRGGIRIFLNSPLAVGTSLYIEINLPHDKQPLFAKSRIVWTQDDDAGLSFDDVRQEDINRILRYITHKEKISLSRKW